MSETLSSDSLPWSEPPCCLQFFICTCHGELAPQCLRHTENPCGHAEAHGSITREQWHDWAERWERQTLDRHITAHQVLEAFGLPDWWAVKTLNFLI